MAQDFLASAAGLTAVNDVGPDVGRGGAALVIIVMAVP
jgi:hypothetical protein